MAPTRPMLPSLPLSLSLSLPLAFVLVALASLPAPARGQTPGARVQPPPALACPRERLTLYGGEVRRYQRRQGRTVIVIDTDWGTRESVTLRHPGRADAAAWFLMQGQPFTAADWARIESAPGRLQPRQRAAAWVCDDGRNATVDWQPPRAP